MFWKFKKRFCIAVAQFQPATLGRVLSFYPRIKSWQLNVSGSYRCVQISSCHKLRRPHWYFHNISHRLYGRWLWSYGQDSCQASECILSLCFSICKCDTTRDQGVPTFVNLTPLDISKEIWGRFLDVFVATKNKHFWQEVKSLQLCLCWSRYFGQDHDVSQTLTKWIVCLNLTRAGAQLCEKIKINKLNLKKLTCRT